MACDWQHVACSSLPCHAYKIILAAPQGTPLCFDCCSLCREWCSQVLVVPAVHVADAQLLDLFRHDVGGPEPQRAAGQRAVLLLLQLLEPDGGLHHATACVPPSLHAPTF